MTEQEFRKLCENHDLTYEYSDDQSVWRRGSESMSRVRAAANELDREVAVRIWNEVVDSQLSEQARSMFYWKV